MYGRRKIFWLDLSVAQILATVADSDYSGDTRCIARDLARFASKPIRMNSGWMPLLKDAPHSPQKRQRD